MGSYSSIIMTKDFHIMNIPKLPVFTTEDGIKRIKEFFGDLIDWRNINDLIPKTFKSGPQNMKTGKAGIFAGSLELVKEGNLTIKQKDLYADIYVKEVKWLKRKKSLNNNIVKFPSKLSSGEREVEAIIFAASEPLDIDTIESKISKKLMF